MSDNIESLVRKAKEGDRQAFADIYEAHFDRIYRYLILRVGNTADAEDLTEQVFLKALESISGFKWRGVPFASWLFRIANNQAIDFFRWQSRRRHVPLDESMLPTQQGLAQQVEAKMRISELIESMSNLTDLQRQVIALRFGAQMRTAQVAQVMDRTPGAVKALQHSALVSLRRIITMDQMEIEN